MHNNLRLWVDEFYDLEDGVRINNPNEFATVSINARFSRRSLKHFVETRKRKGNSREEINYLLSKLAEVTDNPHLELPNPNSSYPGSILLGRFYEDIGKSVMVVLDRGSEVRDIISLHFKKKSDFQKLLRQNKNTV